MPSFIPQREKTLGLLLLGLVTLAGCASENKSVNSIVLHYEGDEGGDHQNTLTCGEKGQLAGVGSVGEGQLYLTVRDGNGTIKFENTYDGTIDFEGQNVRGKSGMWTIRVERSGDDLLGDPFAGSYTFTLAC